MVADSRQVSTHQAEVSTGERFAFGENWARFLAVLDDKRIDEAVASLKENLEVATLEGTSFLDIGSGSGLFSLAARKLGARVHSFDFDPNSVACTAELKRRYFAGDTNWTVQEGSALDREFVASLGQFDVVYSWGVLHHTGQMWKGLENAAIPVAAGGKLFIAIYNDTGTQSLRWRWIKKTYNQLPGFLRSPFAVLAIAPDEMKSAIRATIKLRPQQYIRSWTNYDQNNRGMSRWHDIIDWVGGYPYEVATPEEIFNFYRKRNFSLTKLKSGKVGLGCNEFVFQKEQAAK
ncbi:MAG TPA: class I SAM-dependent methyltransferase [Pyrinomonadaceae bacterium]|nr:class I SAM-dependent methyltransferase [Pyrinomonadaceae bacterium]